MRNLIFILCFIIYLCSGTVSTIISIYLPDATTELMYQSHISKNHFGTISAYISSSFLYGWMIGGCVFGIISDRIGRVKLLAFVSAMYGIATLLIVFVSNWNALLIYRFIAGLGVGGVILIANLYISEIWNEKNRPIALGILAAAFPIGIVATGILYILIPEWRQAFWLGLIPVIASIIIYKYCPESTQWKNRHINNSTQNKSLWNKAIRTKISNGTIIFGSVLIGLWGIFSWLPTWVQSLIPNNLNGEKERGITMMLLGIGGIIGGIISGFLINSIGVYKTLIITFLGLTINCLVLFTNITFHTAIYIEIATLSLFFGISQGSLSNFIPQLFPTEIRATATGFCFNAGRLFTATAVFFVGSFVNALGGLSQALLTFSLSFLIALFATFFNTELK